jgi:aldose 1-epimerase
VPASEAWAPSGEQIELRHGDQTAVVVTVGGAIRSFRDGRGDIIDGYGADAMADGARGQTLIPWPNRVRDGKWAWRGEQRQLALTEPAQHNAIHGLVRWLGWSVADRSADSATLSCVSWPQQGYPWPLEVSVRYRLGDPGLTVEQSITNRGDSPAPVAAGAHPYLTVGTETIDEALLHLDAEAWLDTGDQQIPTGPRAVVGTPYDFRTPRPIGTTQIDYTFTQLRRDADGRFRVRMQHPSGDRTVELWVDTGYDYVEVFTGDALPDPGRRRRSLGVEPMTAPPNALASGTGLTVLEPGETWTGRWGVRADPS